jgi:hypothetical protein
MHDAGVDGASLMVAFAAPWLAITALTFAVPKPKSSTDALRDGL